jgi:hypothetical protein
MNPEARLGEIAFKLNFFISWPNFVTQIFPAILGLYSILTCHEMIRATFWKRHATATFYGKSIFAFNHHAELHI